MYGQQASRSQRDHAPAAAFTDSSARGASSVLGTAEGLANRQPELPAVTERLESALARVADLAERLDNRVTGTVARPSVPMPEPGNQIKGAMNTGLGAHLDTLHERACAVESRLDSLLQRLEF